MQTQTIQLQSAAITYEKYGEGDVNLVIEIGLGASMAEWRRLAKNLAGRHTVLLYQRAGYGASSTSTLERTPENIAAIRPEVDRLREKLLPFNANILGSPLVMP